MSYGGPIYSGWTSSLDFVHIGVDLYQRSSLWWYCARGELCFATHESGVARRKEEVMVVDSCSCSLICVFR